jgi:hypothetical protein
MAKAYWVATYRSISNHDALAAYAKLAGYESGVLQRTVIIEFDGVAKATAAHDSPGYQEALRALGQGADRDIRIVEGVE